MEKKLRMGKEIERLDFTKETKYNAIEAAIHLNRYGIAKPFCKGARVLDAACGEGYGSYLMKSWGAARVDGIDIDVSSVDIAGKLFRDEGLVYTSGTVERLPFEDNAYDLVVSLETIEHLDDAEAFLREIKRVLKPDGTVILSCPNDNYYFERDHLENPFHKRHYTFFEFRELAEKHLGINVDYFLAFALDGFINIPYERRTEPERGGWEDAFGLLHYTQCEQALCVPQERYLNQWNANYYVGIWGKPERAHRYSAVLAPREMFIDHADRDYDLLYHLNDVRSEIKRLQDTVEERDEKLRQTQSDCDYRLQQIQDRHEADLQQKQSDCEARLQQLEELGKQLRRAKAEQETMSLELNRARVLLELTKRERDSARQHMNENWSLYQSALERAGTLESAFCREEQRAKQLEESRQAALVRIQSMESSRGVQLLAKLYDFRMRIRRFFHR